IGRNFIKKPEEIQEEDSEITEEEEETESTTPVPFQNISCPNCGASIQFNAESCSECGKIIEKE
ncbi:MAG: hypothetical protein KAT57_04885, partial [Candidatus Lokiarchaeota archaeon]|nr:hypothetical protein [Candidatus Lokiarchaeota archaeon]